MVKRCDISEIKFSSKLHIILNMWLSLFGTFILGILQAILITGNTIFVYMFHYWDLFMNKSGRKRLILDKENKEPYLIRYYLLYKPGDTEDNSTLLFNIFLHKIVKSDDDEYLHDHPWNFFNIILKGGYYETLFKKSKSNQIKSELTIWRPPGYYSKHDSTHSHKILLKNNTPCWTIFIHFKRIRPWGFWRKYDEETYSWVESEKYFKEIKND